MEETIQIAPFVIQLEADRAVFRFAETDELTHDYPSNLESLIRGMLDREDLRLPDRQVTIDLGNVRAISSRQLGSLLIVHRVICPDAKLAIHNVGQNVRRLFDMARMGELFDY